MINMHTVFSQLTYSSITISVRIFCRPGSVKWKMNTELTVLLAKWSQMNTMTFSIIKVESPNLIYSLFLLLSLDGFVLFFRSYLDMSKVIIFSYLFWFVLTIIFITGTTRISIFCMGYLVACFYFLLFGGDLLLKPIKSILRYWDWLIAYNVFVITMKNILSVSGSHCVTHLCF